MRYVEAMTATVVACAWRVARDVRGVWAWRARGVAVAWRDRGVRGVACVAWRRVGVTMATVVMAVDGREKACLFPTHPPPYHHTTHTAIPPYRHTTHTVIPSRVTVSCA